MTTTTRDEIRQAVAWGQQVAVRELLDLLAKGRRGPDHWVAVSGWQAGFDDATGIVRGYRIDPTEEPT